MTQRRLRGRTFDPDVLKLINEAVDTGASAGSIRRWLERKLDPETPIPSERSIQNYRRERLEMSS